MTELSLHTARLLENHGRWQIPQQVPGGDQMPSFWHFHHERKPLKMNGHHNTNSSCLKGTGPSSLNFRTHFIMCSDQKLWLVCVSLPSCTFYTGPTSPYWWTSSWELMRSSQWPAEPRQIHQVHQVPVCNIMQVAGMPRSTCPQFINNAFVPKYLTIMCRMPR